MSDAAEPPSVGELAVRVTLRVALAGRLQRRTAGSADCCSTPEGARSGGTLRRWRYHRRGPAGRASDPYLSASATASRRDAQRGPSTPSRRPNPGRAAGPPIIIVGCGKTAHVASKLPGHLRSRHRPAGRQRGGQSDASGRDRQPDAGDLGPRLAADPARPDVPGHAHGKQRFPDRSPGDLGRADRAASITRSATTPTARC
jgi:hypothetical protein